MLCCLLAAAAVALVLVGVSDAASLFLHSSCWAPQICNNSAAHMKTLAFGAFQAAKNALPPVVVPPLFCDVYLQIMPASEYICHNADTITLYAEFQTLSSQEERSVLRHASSFGGM